ncbi:MAG: tetratricopeptide repeat protein [Myxococcota bacterium]
MPSRTTPCALALSACALFGLFTEPASAKGPVLGPDAAAPVRAWTAGLKGLRPAGTSIKAGSVVVSLGATCDLVLSHPSEASCPDPTPVGNARACWLGKGCPSEARQTSSLSAAGAIALPWRDAGPGTSPDRQALLTVRTEIQRYLVRGDHEAARASLRGLLQRRDVRAIDWLSLTPLLAWAGEGRAAWELASSEALAPLGPARLATLRALLLIGPESSRGVAEALMTSTDACDMTSFAWSFLALRQYATAGGFAASIRRLDPACFDAYAIEAEAWTILRRLPDQKTVSEAALARFKGDPRLRPIEEAYLVDHGQRDVVQKRLEARIAGGDAAPGTLKRLLLFYIAVEGRVARLKRFRDRADADPKDVLANFFAGVLLHYEKGFQASSRYLSSVIGKVSDEPRLYIYLAMNAFNLGDRATAERYISRAETLDLEDPDVPYCIAEIFRDSDRRRAVDALDRYWEMTRYTSDIKSVKQQRVWGMREALKKCLDEGTPVPCPGPWEHTYDSVALGLYPDAPAP